MAGRQRTPKARRPGHHAGRPHGHGEPRPGVRARRSVVVRPKPVLAPALLLDAGRRPALDAGLARPAHRHRRCRSGRRVRRPAGPARGHVIADAGVDGADAVPRRCPSCRRPRAGIHRRGPGRVSAGGVPGLVDGPTDAAALPAIADGEHDEPEGLDRPEWASERGVSVLLVFGSVTDAPRCWRAPDLAEDGTLSSPGGRGHAGPALRPRLIAAWPRRHQRPRRPGLRSLPG